MSTQGTIHSYYLIIDRLRTAPNPTKKELLEYLKRDHEGLLDELVQRILMYGSEVRVLKPAGLVKDIKRNLREALEYYK
jgi:predicted DNA-binding transcriptional regulator YafY